MRRLTRGRRTVLAASILVAAMVVAATCSEGFTRAGLRVSSGEASGRFHHEFPLPVTARDVNYRSSLIYAVADFTIDESEFAKWCRGLGLAERKAHLDRFLFGERGRTPKPVHDGRRFERQSAGGQVVGVFDRELGRASVAYFEYSSIPRPALSTSDSSMRSAIDADAARP